MAAAERSWQLSRAIPIWGWILAALILGVWAISFLVHDTQNSEEAKSQTWQYVIVKEESGTHPDGRTWRQLAIYSAAPDAVSRAQVAVRAAKDRATQTNADFVQVRLLVSPAKIFTQDPMSLADAKYASDGGGIDGSSPLKHGTWEVSSSGAKIPQIQIAAIQQFDEVIDDYPILIVDCRDADAMAGFRRYYEQKLGLTDEQFRRLEASADGIHRRGFRELIASIQSSPDVELLRFADSGCGLTTGDDDRSAFRAVAKRMKLPPAIVEKYINSLAPLIFKSYQSYDGPIE